MNESEKTKALVPLATYVQVEEYENPLFQTSVSTLQSASISIPVNSLDSIPPNVVTNSHYEAAKHLARRTFVSLYRCIPRVIHPHAKVVRRWNRWFLFSCLFTCYIDSLLVFLLYAEQDNMCIAINRTMTKVLIFSRSQITVSVLLHMFLQFRLAYVTPESRLVGSVDLVYHPKRIARNYLSGYFLIDFLVALPLYQGMLWLAHQSNGSFEADVFNWLSVALIFQYMAMFYRVKQTFSAPQPTSRYITDLWSTKLVLTLSVFGLCSHLVGLCWYYIALLRVQQCLKIACGGLWCSKYRYCAQENENGIFKDDPTSWKKWQDNKNATACFGPGHLNYGVFGQAVTLTTKSNIAVRYIYSLFWGFQQISTLAGNQIPAFSVGEVLFTMFITAMGLLMFSYLIGNIQFFLYALERRTLDMSVRRSDVEYWMRHQQLPEILRRQVRKSERYNWAATRGANDLMLLENLPEDLQRDIRRHLFNFVEKYPIFAQMDVSILDDIRDRLKQKTYIEGSRILIRGGLIRTMVFIVQGKLESIGENENVFHLHEGDVCGEELIRLCLEHSFLNRDGENFRIPAHKLLCNRTVRCVTNVNAFAIQAADLEEVFSFYSGLLVKNLPVQGAIRKESTYRQGFSVNRIKLAWRCRTKRLND